jgi:hypothetical protein
MFLFMLNIFSAVDILLLPGKNPDISTEYYLQRFIDEKLVLATLEGTGKSREKS